MGEITEAAALMEQAVRLDPEDGSLATDLAAIYGALGREMDARAMFEIRTKKPHGAALTLELIMDVHPFKDHVVADRFAKGLLRAGVPPGKISGGYFPAFRENQLNGEEIRSLLYGSKITGFSILGDGQWWRDYKKNGDFTWRGPSTFFGLGSDNGKSWIKGDMICHQFQKRLWGLEFSGTVFRNPRGTYEGKAEYFFCTDMGPAPFSLVR